jgi:hypothetical protein
VRYPRMWTPTADFTPFPACHLTCRTLRWAAGSPLGAPMPRNDAGPRNPPSPAMGTRLPASIPSPRSNRPRRTRTPRSLSPRKLHHCWWYATWYAPFRLPPTVCYNGKLVRSARWRMCRSPSTPERPSASSANQAAARAPSVGCSWPRTRRHRVRSPSMAPRSAGSPTACYAGIGATSS